MNMILDRTMPTAETVDLHKLFGITPAEPPTPETPVAEPETLEPEAAAVMTVSGQIPEFNAQTLFELLARLAGFSLASWPDHRRAMRCVGRDRVAMSFLPAEMSAQQVETATYTVNGEVFLVLTRGIAGYCHMATTACAGLSAELSGFIESTSMMVIPD